MTSFTWRGEALAGATIWALLVPSALAYAGIIGVSPLVGLVGVPFALVGYALFGGSKILVVAADAAVTVLVASTLTGVGRAGDPEALVALTFLVAAIFLAMRLLRFGWVADLIPESVLKGFIQGLTVVTIVEQIPKLIGADGVDLDGGFFSDLAAIARGLDTAQSATAVLGLAAAMVLLTMMVRWPKLPSALIVLAVSGLAVAVFDLADRGVSVVGEPTGDLFGSGLAIPTDGHLLWQLVPGAFAIVMLGFTESLGAAQLVSESDGERIEPNRELLGLGAANLGVAISGGYAVTGALSKTAVAVSSGARTQRANMVAAALAVIAALFGRPLFDYLASPVLAAVVIWAMAGMLDLGYFRLVWRENRVEFAVAVVAGIGVLVFGVMPAVVLGSLLALVVLAHHVARPPIAELVHRADGSWRPADWSPGAAVAGLRVCQIQGPLVFVSARACCDRIRELSADGGVEVILVDTRSVSAVDTTGIHALTSLAAELRHRDVELWFVLPTERVRHRTELIESSPIGRAFISLGDGIAAFAHRGDVS